MLSSGFEDHFDLFLESTNVGQHVTRESALADGMKSTYGTPDRKRKTILRQFVSGYSID